jgi:hypothetical protein
LLETSFTKQEGDPNLNQERVRCLCFIADVMIAHVCLVSTDSGTCEVGVAFRDGTIWPKPSGFRVKFVLALFHSRFSAVSSRDSSLSQEMELLTNNLDLTRSIACPSDL